MGIKHKKKKSRNTKRPIKNVYQKYIRSKEWQIKRKALFKERGRRCEDCFTTKNLHVHHLHYRTLTRESFGDLKILCEECHKKEHIRIDNEEAELRKLEDLSKLPRIKRNGILINNK